MQYSLIVLAVLFVCALAGAASSDGALLLDHERPHQSLNGSWRMLLEHGDEEVWNPAVRDAAGWRWHDVTVPGPLLTPPKGRNATREQHQKMHETQMKTKFVWIRRTFEVGADRAKQNAVLKWGGIRFGAKVWVNGKLVADWVPISPHTVLLPKGLLKAGKNDITIRIPGWAGLPKSKSGYPLTPTGGATQNWGGKGPAVFGDIWLEFYDKVYLKRVLAMPDVEKKTVTFRVQLDSVEAMPEKVDVEAMVIRPGAGLKFVPTARVCVSGRDSADITCDPGSPELWTPQSPALYQASISAAVDGERCDGMDFYFGFRQITIKGGHFALNGKRLWLRGSNLVHEWGWGEKFNENVKQYIVDEARNMSLNCFRTHTEPPTTLWANTGDRYGTMILAETPLLYNHGDFKFTPEELEVFHRNALLDAEGWVTKLWNHPSIIIWVISNESRFDKEWESTVLWKHVRDLDPTRPIMRTGDVVKMVGTPDMVDTHTCFNMYNGGEGQLAAAMADLMAKKDPKRPLCNTEYMNRMWNPVPRWLGKEDDPAWPLTFAECATEHTEAMRRLRFDCLLPYMYAGWTNLRTGRQWRPEFPTPMAAALHSSMAPVLASLDMLDRNYVAGSTLKTRAMLINELHEPVKGTLELYVTPKHPQFVPDEPALKAAVWKTSMPVEMKPDSAAWRALEIPVPKAEGVYYLAAVLRRDGVRPVVSQRELRAIDTTRHADALEGRKVRLLGGDETISHWLRAQGAEIVPAGGDVALVWDAEGLTDAEKKTAEELKAFAAGGGRIVVVDQAKWTWPGLVDVEIGLPEKGWRNPVEASRAHIHEKAVHPMLRDMNPVYFWRWNGQQGAITDAIVLDGPVADAGAKLLWVSAPKYTAVRSLPMGKGEVLMSQLRLRRRIDRKSADYDPVAERLLRNLLSR